MNIKLSIVNNFKISNRTFILICHTSKDKEINNLERVLYYFPNIQEQNDEKSVVASHLLNKEFEYN